MEGGNNRRFSKKKKNRKPAIFSEREIESEIEVQAMPQWTTVEQALPRQ